MLAEGAAVSPQDNHMNEVVNMRQYKVYRTFKIKVEAESIVDAHKLADQIDLFDWEFDGQEVEGGD